MPLEQSRSDHPPIPPNRSEELAGAVQEVGALCLMWRPRHLMAMRARRAHCSPAVPLRPPSPPHASVFYLTRTDFLVYGRTSPPGPGAPAGVGPCQRPHQRTHPRTPRQCGGSTPLLHATFHVECGAHQGCMAIIGLGSHPPLSASVLPTDARIDVPRTLATEPPARPQTARG
jgi:hypothetical protein